MIRRITLAVFLGALFVPASAQAYVPNRAEAIDDIRSLLHNGTVAEAMFQREPTPEEVAEFDLAPGVTVNDERVVAARGNFWRGNLHPKVLRVKGGWDSGAVLFSGLNSEGGLERVIVGSFRIRSYRGGYTTAFVPYTAAKAAPYKKG